MITQTGMWLKMNEDRSTSFFITFKIKTRTNGHFLKHPDDVFGYGCNVTMFLQYVEIMKSIGNVSLSSIKPWIHTQCLFYSQIKAWDSPPHNWSIQSGFWKLLSLPVKTLPLGTNCSLASLRKMHVLIPSTHLFPSQHKQINGWRWIGLTSLQPCLMRKVLILTVVVHAQQKEVLKKGE